MGFIDPQPRVVIVPLVIKNSYSLQPKIIAPTHCKDQLIDLMIDAVMIDGLKPGAEHWRAEMTAWAKADLSLYLTHPWLSAAVTRPTLGPNWTKWLDAALHTLSGLNLPTSHMMSILLLVDGHIRSAAQITVGAKAAREWEENFGRMLKLIGDNQQYPTISRMLNTGGFEQTGDDLNDMFLFGLDRLLDGIEVIQPV